MFLVRWSGPAGISEFDRYQVAIGIKRKTPKIVGNKMSLSIYIQILLYRYYYRKHNFIKSHLGFKRKTQTVWNKMVKICQCSISLQPGYKKNANYVHLKKSLILTSNHPSTLNNVAIEEIPSLKFPKRRWLEQKTIDVAAYKACFFLFKN